VPTDFESLVPETVAAEVVASVTEQQSAVMQLARIVRMPSGIEQIPLVTASPTSGFVSPQYGGLKPSGEVEWTAATLTAAEIGSVVPVPDAFVADTTFDIWGSVRDEVIKSFVRVFELAALFGTNAPTAWPVGGITAAAQADVATGADELAALDAAIGLLESRGVTVDGILAGPKLRAALRSKLVTSLQPFTTEPLSIWGIPLTYSTYWDDSLGVALVGGWDGVIAGVREDMTFSMSSEGVISDATGKILLNALQSDSSIMRTYWRLALQVVEPLGPQATPVKTLALAKVGVGTMARSKAA
jgi:hypothetical protein